MGLLNKGKYKNQGLYIHHMCRMSYVISDVSGLLIILLSILILECEEENLQYEHEIDHNHSGIQ